MTDFFSDFVQKNREKLFLNGFIKIDKEKLFDIDKYLNSVKSLDPRTSMSTPPMPCAPSAKLTSSASVEIDKREPAAE